VMSLPTVALGIIPMMTERAAVGSTGFWIFDNTLVALETPTASIEVTRPQEIELYTRMFERLRTSAVYGHAARALIRQAKDDPDRRRSPQQHHATFLRAPILPLYGQPHARDQPGQNPHHDPGPLPAGASG